MFRIILKHLGYKTWTLHLHPELHVEHPLPLAAPGVSHVLVQLQHGEHLAQPVGDDLVGVDAECREVVEDDQEHFGDE